MARSVATIIQAIALRLPSATKGIACAGTKLEATTFEADGKAFAFLRRTEAGYEVRLKLRASADEARALAAAEPARWAIGANGWTKLAFDGATVPVEQLRRWIPESYALVATPKAGKATAVSGSGSAARARPARGR